MRIAEVRAAIQVVLAAATRTRILRFPFAPGSEIFQANLDWVIPAVLILILTRFEPPLFCRRRIVVCQDFLRPRSTCASAFASSFWQIDIRVVLGSYRSYRSWPSLAALAILV